MKINNQEYKEYIGSFNDPKDQAVRPSKNNDLDKDAFLKLLTTQLANQDPLNPIEDKEFIAQLAQFNSLEQMQSLNKNMETLGEGVLESIEYLNLNQIQANVEILKEITNIRKAIESYLGVETKPEEAEDEEVADVEEIE